MEVDLPNILKRCSSAPVFAAENGSLSNKINQNVNLSTNKTYQKEALPNSLSTTQKNHIQDKIINSLIEKNSTNSISNSYSSSSPSVQSSSSCSSPIRSREASPAPFNIFAPRARRYSASFAATVNNNGTVGPRLTPRVSQLRQEECVDANSREVNHEREVHSAMQMSQSCEDLTLIAENWSCKSEDFNNSLQSAPPTNNLFANRQCSSPSPTSRTGIKINLHSPSPTRRTFATRRSMSPIAMRPSQLGPVKRKFELDDGNWSNNYSPPPLKKRFTQSIFNPSEIFNLPSPTCPNSNSPNTDGDTTESKLYAPQVNNNVNLEQSKSPLTFPPVIKDLGIFSESSINQPKCCIDIQNKKNLIDNEKQIEMDVVNSNINETKNITNFWNKPTFENKPSLNLESTTLMCSNSDKCMTNLFSAVSNDNESKNNVV